MECERLVFSGHAIRRMFQRGIGRDEVVAVLSGGETIAEYPDDTPYPSRLVLGFTNGKPVHVVVARDAETDTCIVVTVYEPHPDQWEVGFRRRKSG